MRLALLGSDDSTLEFVREIAARSEHSIVWACELTENEGAIRAAARELICGEHWELLLGGTVADAVIVARHENEELRVEQLRKLLQAGVPTLVAHPICRSMLLAYELEMIRADTKTVLVPYLPDRLCDSVASLTQWLFQNGQEPADPFLGRVEQVVLERSMKNRSKESVAAQFAKDADLLQAICGELNRMSAQGGPLPESAYPNLAVQMSGAAEIPVRWTVVPTTEMPSGKLIVTGAQGVLTIRMPGQGRWEFHASNGTPPFPPDRKDWSPAVALLAELERAIAGRSSPGAASWNNACRAIEMTEGIDRCLKRGRAIDFHREDYTEEKTFKGIMTPLGCGLLVGGVAFACGIGVLQFFANAFHWEAGVAFLKGWPYILLGVFVVFLALQALLVVTRKPEDAESPVINSDQDDAME